jgi:phage shock protein PspC (stress-responsive transcriptional regulator)
VADRHATDEGVTDMTRRLTRPRDNRWIAGVCAGLAYRFGLSPNVVRLLFVLSCLLPGPQVLIYLVLWIVLPNEERPAATY